jgi:hypothetical protein
MNTLPVLERLNMDRVGVRVGLRRVRGGWADWAGWPWAGAGPRGKNRKGEEDRVGWLG